jgi:phosphatidate cytidylyltransferase
MGAQAEASASGIGGGSGAARGPEPARAERASTTEPARADPSTGSSAGASRVSRAGRNLPAAIIVALVLGGAVLASLLFWKPAFYLVVVAAVGIGTWELTRAVASAGGKPPLPPLLAGGPVTVLLAWYGGAPALPFALLGTVVAVLAWRLIDGPTGYQRDVVSALLVAMYVPFLAGFAVLLVNPHDGHLRILATLIAVVLSDTGGYAAGVFLGQHPMAPSVSPKKSWEGFGGSMLAAAAGGAVMLYLMFDAAWWHGALFGLAIAVASTLGDLAESVLKRDLRIKDMSSLLPGHGGLMDRLDSILIAAPTAYMVLSLLAPPG